MTAARAVRTASALVLLPVVLAAVLGGRRLGLSLVTVLVRFEYPAIRWIAPAELGGEMPGPMLLDVREAREFAVSHLAGARLLAPGGPLPKEVLAIPRNVSIVTYCAVGRRSARVAAQLQAAGFTRVRNLEGGIFRWANEDRPLVDAAGAIGVVHPYSRSWGLLVRARHRAAP